MRSFYKLALIVFVLANNANAIVIRHDVDDSQYRQFGEHYSSSVAYVGGCTSTLIASTWLLTAAHCVYGREGMLFSAKHLDKDYRISKVIVHPKFKDDKIEKFDIALIQLMDVIKNGKPAELYDLKNELGKEVVFVGRGEYGNGKEGLIKFDGLQRGATNTVVKVNSDVIVFQFNEPEKATAMEGISGPGDSGGPAFILVDNKLYVAGVSSWQDGNEQKEGHYNVLEHYTRVSTNSHWLNSILDKTKVVPVVKHPIIDLVKKGDIVGLDTALKANQSWRTNIPILNEAFYQALMLDEPAVLKGLVNVMEAKLNSVRINNMSLIEFSIYFDKKRHFEMLMNEIDDKKIIHPKGSALLPMMVKKYIHDKQVISHINLALKQGAGINAVNGAKATALLIAAYRTNLDVVKYLIAHGADVNIANRNGNTPIGVVAWKTGNVEVMNYLIKQGADINLANHNGDTPLGLLVWDTNYFAAIKCLVEQGADVNIANVNGDTPAMDAAYLGKTDILRYLINNGADLSLKNKKSNTALELAKLKNNKDVINLLEAHMKKS